jgi:hypothetical protein
LLAGDGLERRASGAGVGAAPGGAVAGRGGAFEGVAEKAAHVAVSGHGGSEEAGIRGEAHRTVGRDGGGPIRFARWRSAGTVEEEVAAAAGW